MDIIEYKTIAKKVLSCCKCWPRLSPAGAFQWLGDQQNKTQGKSLSQVLAAHDNTWLLIQNVGRLETGVSRICWALLSDWQYWIRRNQYQQQSIIGLNSVCVIYCSIIETWLVTRTLTHLHFTHFDPVISNFKNSPWI